jgi:hypothetical protein
MQRHEAIGFGLSQLGDHLVMFGNLQQEETRFAIPDPIRNVTCMFGAL